MTDTRKILTMCGDRHHSRMYQKRTQKYRKYIYVEKRTIKDKKPAVSGIIIFKNLIHPERMEYGFNLLFILCMMSSIEGLFKGVAEAEQPEEASKQCYTINIYLFINSMSLWKRYGNIELHC